MPCAATRSRRTTSTASSSFRVPSPVCAWRCCSGTSATAASRYPSDPWAKWTSQHSRISSAVAVIIAPPARRCPARWRTSRSKVLTAARHFLANGQSTLTAPVLKSRVEQAARRHCEIPVWAAMSLRAAWCAISSVDAQGAVSLTFVLTRDDPGSLRAASAQRVERSRSERRQNEHRGCGGGRGGGGRRSRSTAARRAGTRGPCAAHARRNADASAKVLAISSGKGGVGKSTVSANLAAALARDGHRVGLMDADIYGPEYPAHVRGETTSPKCRAARSSRSRRIGVKLMSLGFIVERDAPAIWRGPIIMKRSSRSPCATSRGASSTISWWIAARHRRCPALAHADRASSTGR